MSNGAFYMNSAITTCRARVCSRCTFWEKKKTKEKHMFARTTGNMKRPDIHNKRNVFKVQNKVVEKKERTSVRLRADIRKRKVCTFGPT